MKYLIISIISLSMFSCSKEITTINALDNDAVFAIPVQDAGKPGKKTIKKSLLTNKWKLIQVQEQIANGGDSNWSNVDPSSSHCLKFLNNSRFIRTEGLEQNSKVCAGTYKIIDDSQISVITTCNSDPEIYEVEELTATTLILVIPVREGVIKYKYTRN